MLTTIKRYLFTQMLSNVESEAVREKKWGNNIQTAHCLATMIQRHKKLIDLDMFKDKRNTTSITSSFISQEELFSWLKTIKKVYSHFIDTNGRSFPEEYKHLVLVKTYEVPLSTLMYPSGNIEDIYKFVDELSKELDFIHTLDKISQEVVRNSLRVKFSNGFNTVLLLEELILEVMIDG